MDFLRLTNIIRIILLFSIAPSYGQRLSAVYSSTSLEYPSSLIAAFHDGDDSIYVFGGLGDIGFIRKIYLYNITSDTIRTIGSISASRLHAGSIQQDKDGNLLYFGNEDVNYRAIKFDPVQNTTCPIPDTPDLNGCRAIKYN